MLQINHNQFMSAFQSSMRAAFSNNQNQEVIILGAVQLYWKHSKNIAYLNDALQYASATKGLRVNAVRAFLDNFTGAVYDKESKKFKGAGRSVKELPADFNQLNSWLEWADKEAAEPEYNLVKQQLKVIQFLQNQKKVAIEHDQQEMADMLSNTITQYVEANKKVEHKEVKVA